MARRKDALDARYSKECVYSTAPERIETVVRYDGRI